MNSELLSFLGVMNISRCALGHALVLLALLGVLAEATERCQTLSTNVFVTKEKTYEYNGRRVRLLCAGNLDVTKCEGACLSQVSPSVVHFPGFKKVSSLNVPHLKKKALRVMTWKIALTYSTDMLFLHLTRTNSSMHGEIVA